MRFRDHVPIGKGDETGRTQMIAEHEVECTTAPHGDALRACVVILGDNTVGHFVVIAHEVGGGGTEIRRQHRFDALSVAVPSTSSGQV